MDPADYAYTQLAVREATGANDGIPAERYMRGDELAWCAGFVMWCFDQADRKIYANTKQYYRYRSVTAMLASLRAKGLACGPRVRPHRNWLIFYKNHRSPSGSHVGIVESVGAEHVYSIEGNLSDAVRRRSNRLSDGDILAYAAP